MNDINKDLAFNILFQDPETGEELRPVTAPTSDGCHLRIIVSNKDGTREWLHTIITQEL